MGGERVDSECGRRFGGVCPGGEQRKGRGWWDFRLRADFLTPETQVQPGWADWRGGQETAQPRQDAGPPGSSPPLSRGNPAFCLVPRTTAPGMPSVHFRGRARGTRKYLRRGGDAAGRVVCVLLCAVLPPPPPPPWGSDSTRRTRCKLGREPAPRCRSPRPPRLCAALLPARSWSPEPLSKVASSRKPRPPPRAGQSPRRPRSPGAPALRRSGGALAGAVHTPPRRPAGTAPSPSRQPCAPPLRSPCRP